MGAWPEMDRATGSSLEVFMSLPGRVLGTELEFLKMKDTEKKLHPGWQLEKQASKKAT